MGLAEDELRAIEMRWTTAEQPQGDELEAQADVVALIAEIRRLQEVLRAWEDAWKKSGLAGP
jgi:hypothetical protein